MRSWKIIALGLLLLGGPAISASQAEITVSSNFENGSGEVLSLDALAQHVQITPAGKTTRGWPNWWYVRLDGIDPEKPLTVEVVSRDVSFPNEGGVIRKLSPRWTLPERAAVSYDGVKWEQSAPTDLARDRRIYTVAAKGSTLWLAWGPPFTVTDARAFVDQLARAHPFAQAFSLAKSREGREVPAVRIAEGDRPVEERPAIWLTGRQHAWECGGTWVGVGFIEWLVGDRDEARWLRRHAEVFFVPVLDVDHVVTGDGGKECEPQDHNRDWSAQPHWPEVAALQHRLRAAAQEKRLEVFLDLHNPGDRNLRQTFYVHYPPLVSEAAAAAQEKFLANVRNEFGAITLYDGKPSIPEHMEIWRRFSTSWVLTHGNPHTISLTVETPWNTAEGTANGYRAVGAKLARATEKYLRLER